MSKAGRNDPCTCGSGKKYKKCCETKHKKKLFNAEVINPAAGLSSLFKNNVATKLPPKEDVSAPSNREQKEKE